MSVLATDVVDLTLAISELMGAKEMLARLDQQREDGVETRHRFAFERAKAEAYAKVALASSLVDNVVLGPAGTGQR